MAAITVLQRDTEEESMRWRGSILAAAAVLGCTTPLELDQADLAGTYFWTESEGGIAGRELTPESEGYTVRVVLDGSGEASAFRNDSLVATVRYDVTPRLSLVEPGADPEYEIVFDPPLPGLLFASIENGVLRLRDSSLTIEEPCCDRYAHTFARGGEQ